MRGRRTFTVRRFGGLVPRASAPNPQVSRYTLEGGQTSRARSVLFGPNGSLVGRDGDAVQGDTPDPQTAAYAAVALGDILSGDAANLYRIDPATGTKALILGAFSATSPWSFAPSPLSSIFSSGIVYATNGAQQRKILSASSSAWTASAGTLPNSRFLLNAGNRIWAAFATNLGTSDPGSTLAWSEIGDPDDWPAANVLLLDPGDGDDLTGLGRVGDYIAVFKGRKTFLIYDLDTGANRMLSATVGCKDGRSIVSTPYGVVFLSANGGVMVTDGSSVRPLGPPTEALFAGAQIAGAAFWRDRYIVTVAEYASAADAHPTRYSSYSYDFREQTWTDLDLDAGALVVWDDELWGFEPKLMATSGATEFDYYKLMVDGDSTDADGDPVVGEYDLMLKVDDGQAHRVQAVRAVGKGAISFTLLDPSGLAAIGSAPQGALTPSGDSAEVTTRGIVGLHRALMVRLSIPAGAEVHSVIANTIGRRD
jgi:hypothetical protein